MRQRQPRFPQLFQMLELQFMKVHWQAILAFKNLARGPPTTIVVVP